MFFSREVDVTGESRSHAQSFAAESSKAGIAHLESAPASSSKDRIRHSGHIRELTPASLGQAVQTHSQLAFAFAFLCIWLNLGVWCLIYATRYVGIYEQERSLAQDNPERRQASQAPPAKDKPPDIAAAAAKALMEPEPSSPNMDQEKSKDAESSK